MTCCNISVHAPIFVGYKCPVCKALWFTRKRGDEPVRWIPPIVAKTGLEFTYARSKEEKNRYTAKVWYS